jgi:antitoxin StbD
MKRLFTNQICTMTELREPQKVLDAAGGKPVAIMKNSKCIGYLVPEAATLQDEPRHATMDEVMTYLRSSRDRVQPVLDYLKDK